VLSRTIAVGFDSNEAVRTERLERAKAASQRHVSSAATCGAARTTTKSPSSDPQRRSEIEREWQRGITGLGLGRGLERVSAPDLGLQMEVILEILQELPRQSSSDSDRILRRSV
jgi:hypothetical protein